MASDTYVVAPVQGLINGISQQSDGSRYSGQAEDQLNAWSTPNYGVSKRNPTEYVALAKNAPYSVSGNAGLKTISARTAIGDVIAVADGNGIKIFSTSGYEYPVTYQDASLAYVTNSTENLAFATYEDTIFVVNKDATPSMLSNSAVLNKTKAFVFIKSVTYRSEYTLKVRMVGGVEFVAKAQVWDGSTRGEQDLSGQSNRPATAAVAVANSMVPTVPQIDVRTSEVAESLGADLYKAVYTYSNSLTTADSVVKWDINKSVIEIDMSVIGEIESVTITDSEGSGSAFAIFNETSNISNLPLNAPRGHTVKIVGLKDAQEDDFWVKFVPYSEASAFVSSGSSVRRLNTDRQINGYLSPAGSNLRSNPALLHAELPSGYWEECADPTVDFQINAETMPRIIQYDTVTLSFIVKAAPWASRQAGDDDSNPIPDVIAAGKIKAIFFYRGRLGFAYNTLIAFSEKGQYFNFFRTTVQNLVDSDAFEVDLLTGGRFRVNFAISFEGSLILLGSESVWQVTAEPILSPSTVSSAKIGEFDCNEYVPPVIVGKSLFFLGVRGATSNLFEMIRIGDTQIFDVSNASSHVPSLIPANIHGMIGSSASNSVMVLASTGKIYVNQFFWVGNEKAQNAWTVWKLGPYTEKTLALNFFDSRMFCIQNRTSDAILSKVNVTENIADAPLDYMVLVDNRVFFKTGTYGNPTYSEAEGTTSITMPTNVPYAEFLEVVGLDGVIGTVDSVSGAVVKIEGDWSAANRPDGFFVGYSYDLEHKFSKPLVRNKNQQGSDTPAYVNRAQVRYGTLAFNRSRSFEIRVDKPDATQFNIPFNHPVLGQPDEGVIDGYFRFSVFRRNTETGVTLVNSSPYPSNFTGIEWELKLANPRGTRYPM